jgi:hypothetical protein
VNETRLPKRSPLIDGYNLLLGQFDDTFDRRNIATPAQRKTLRRIASQRTCRELFIPHASANIFWGFLRRAKRSGGAQRRKPQANPQA